MEATETDLSARISGVIASYGAREGDIIKSGAVIAAIDCGDLRLAEGIASEDFKRAAELYQGGSLSRESYDRLKYKRDDSALKMDWCSVRAPVSGRLLYAYREKGELVAPGTKLATIADLSEVWAYVYVPHDLLAKLKQGMAVTGFLPEAGDKEFPGRITVIYPEAEFTPKNVQTRKERTRLVFAVKVNFPNLDEILKPGMTIEVKLPQ
ncbi:MAG: secretion protein HlyD [Elusimicrobia bacterium RIFOXYA2_FULL_58_8]|nr:MAG: secretion protein HlyD [Elusimicrobia bacterium RIFOXYA2_FULL_58_8]OGS12378.1 MAG: secretion protein HlyD [Elusimicrobia bacterium RIFOXYA12_FULL_57_11]